MRVTEKCDVYSFGVVAIELLVGRHPGELIFSLSSSNDEEVLLKDVLDQRLPTPTTQDEREVTSAMMMALACICANPQSRPTMRQVSLELCASIPPLSEPFCTITLSKLFDINT